MLIGFNFKLNELLGRIREMNLCKYKIALQIYKVFIYINYV